MRTKRCMLGLVLAVAAVALGSGCQDEGAEDAPSSAVRPQTSTEYFHAARDALCARAVACVAYPDTDTCLNAVHDQPSAQTLSDEAHGLVRYNPDGAARCLEAMASARCQQLYGYAALKACEDVFVPAVQPGGDCRMSGDNCVGGYCSPCDSEGNCADACAGGPCCMGFCIAAEDEQVEVGIGESCSGQQCAGDAYCDYNSFTCRALPDVGQSCANSYGCREGAICDYYSLTCYTPSRAGQACQLEVSDAPCDVDLYCDMTTVTCKPLPGPGERCGEGAPCRGINLECSEGVCSWLANVGEHCDEVSRCLRGLDCSDDGFCEAPDGALVCE